MPDLILKCQNCQNPFVYSEWEQKMDTQKGVTRLYCPICTAIKSAAAKHPPKPQK